MRVLFFVISSAVLLLVGCVRTTPPISTREGIAEVGRSETSLPGKQPDGSVLLPNQWSLRPVGKQIELRDFPINIAVHPSGQFVAVLHSGYSAHQVTIVDLM